MMRAKVYFYPGEFPFRVVYVDADGGWTCVHFREWAQAVDSARYWTDTGWQYGARAAVVSENAARRAGCPA